MHIYVTRPQWVNTLMPRLDDYNFSVYQCVFKFIFLYKVYCIMIEISLQSVSIDLIVNKSPLVTGDGLAITKTDDDPFKWCI